MNDFLLYILILLLLGRWLMESSTEISVSLELYLVTSQYEQASSNPIYNKTVCPN